MRYIMVPMFKLVPGMSQKVGDGARRYLQVARYGPEVTGKFFASRPKKLTRPLTEIDMAHFDNRPVQQALWNVTSRVTGGWGIRSASDRKRLPAESSQRHAV